MTLNELLIADDHPLFREALRGLIARLYPSTAIYESDNISSLYVLVEDRPNADLLLLVTVLWCTYVHNTLYCL